MTPRVELEELSRLMDGEVTAAERADIEARLTACPVSMAFFARLQCLNEAVTGATFRRGVQPSAEIVNEEECLSDTTILAVANDTLAEAEINAAETHLVSCLHCLARVMETLRTTMSLRADRWAALPDEARQLITPATSSASASASAPKRPATPEVWHRLSLSLGAESAARTNRVFMTGQLTVKLVARVMMSQELDAQKCLHIECVFHAGTHPRAGQVLIAIDATTRRQVSTARADAAGRLSLPPLVAGNYHLRIQNTPLRIELSVTA